jgi:hypothetical protein
MKRNEAPLHTLTRENQETAVLSERNQAYDHTSHGPIYIHCSEWAGPWSQEADRGNQRLGEGATGTGCLITTGFPLEVVRQVFQGFLLEVMQTL